MHHDVTKISYFLVFVLDRRLFNTPAFLRTHLLLFSLLSADHMTPGESVLVLFCECFYV